MANFLCDVCGVEYTEFSPENVRAILDEDRKFIKFEFVCYDCQELEERMR